MELRSCAESLKRHYYADCAEMCSSCKVTASDLENAHQKWRYEEFYLKRLCKGEKPLGPEAFIAAAKKFKRLKDSGEVFFPDGSQLLNSHRKNNNCATWHENAALYRKYLEEFGTDVFSEANFTKLGWTDKQRKAVQNWRERYSLPNEYGSYGKYRNLAFTGNRHAIVQELHELLRKKQTKGMKRLSSFFGKK